MKLVNLLCKYVYCAVVCKQVFFVNKHGETNEVFNNEVLDYIHCNSFDQMRIRISKN